MLIVFTCLKIRNNSSRGVCLATRRVEGVLRTRLKAQNRGQLITDKAEMSFLAVLGYLPAELTNFSGYLAVHLVQIALRAGNSFCLTPPPIVP